MAKRRSSARVNAATASRQPRPLARFALIAAAFAFAGCGPAHEPRPVAEFVVDRSLGASRLGPAVRVAEHFARAYVAHAYLRHPPRLPEVSAGVADELAIAAARVPSPRRALRPRLLALSLRPQSPMALSASVRVGDGRFAPFSVGFSVKRTAGRWRVVAISLPE